MKHVPAWLLALYPLLSPVLGRQRRGVWSAQIEARRQAERAQQQLERLVRELDREAVLFGRIMIDSLARQGFCYTPSGRHNDPLAGDQHETRRRRRKKTQKIKVELVRYNDLTISYKILVRSKGWWKPRAELPPKVTLTKMMTDDVCTELSGALERRVTCWHDPNHGAWFEVHRQPFGGKVPARVEWHDLLEHYPLEKLADAPMLLGVGENNLIFEATLASHPHVLCAGSTQSGKSNEINQLLATWMRFIEPADMQFVLIDPKYVEFGFYSGSPHLWHDEIITDIEAAIDVLATVSKEMEDRLMIMRDMRVKNLVEFNRATGGRKPRIVVVVEELASLYGVGSGKKAETARRQLIRMGNMGRAAGVHMVLVTQAPKKEIIPIELRANMGVRIAGRVDSAMASMLIIGTGEAAWLEPIPGRMVYAPSADKWPMQAPFISNDEITDCLQIAKGRAAGLLTLDRLTPVPVNEAVLRWQLEHDEGRLSSRRALKGLGAYGLTERMLEPVFALARQREAVEVAGRIYRPERDGEYTRLVLDAEASVTPVEIVANAEEQPTTISTGEADAQAEPASIALAVNGNRRFATVDAALTAFIAECIEPGDTLRPFAPIRDAATIWLDRHHSAPVSDKALGLALANAGFERGRINNKTKGWKVRIRAN